ncbi:MAG: hypothetical protein OIF57_05715 [Marinobacterium sp.]|nr:hypothetical protein [Marinobacterium sp.]
MARRHTGPQDHRRLTAADLADKTAQAAEAACCQALLNCYLYHYLQRLLSGQGLHEDKEQRLHNNPSLSFCMQQLVGLHIQLDHHNSAYSLITTVENRARAQQLCQALQPVVEQHQQQLAQLTRT